MYSISKETMEEFHRAVKATASLQMRVGQVFCNVTKLHRSPMLHRDVEQVLWNLDGEEAYAYIQTNFIVD